MPNDARIIHNFVSTKPTRSDPTRIYGQQWNEDHVITGLEQVDNTSDATKNAAVATLTNKTIDGGANTLTNVPTTSLSGLSANMAAWLASASSANLRATMTDETGTGALVFATSPTLVTPALGTPSSAVLTNATGLPVSTGISGLGTGVAAALAVNVGSAGAPVVNGGALGTPSSGTATNLTGLPLSTGITGAGTGVLSGLAINVGAAGSVVINGGALGTPSSGTLTNATGLPISTGVSGLATGVATFLAAPSSTNLRAALTDEVGTGSAYFVGGALGTPASGTATNLTGLPLSTGITGAGTGVLAALGVNVGTAGAVVVNGGALGTPSSGTLTNATGLPLSGLTTQGAYTIVANSTGSAAVPTAMDVTSLTAKASPASADIVLIQDSAASNAFKKTTVGGIASAAGALPAPELAYWVDRAALLDPAAYVYWQGANWSVTVPTGETWYVVNAWQVTFVGSSVWFHRDLSTKRAFAIPSGTTMSGATASAFLYVCRPSLVSGNSPYANPKNLYYDRLNTLRSYAMNKISAFVASGSPIGTVAKTSFPTDFSDGLLAQVSTFDLAWTILATSQNGGGLNTVGEISDIHEIRFTDTLLTPFRREIFPQIWCQASNMSGNGTDTSLAGSGVIGYYKLPGTWRTSPARAYRTAILSDNPLVYYPFDEVSGTTATNLGSASSLNATYAGAAALGGTGAIGDGSTSAFFPDSTSFVTLPNNSTFDFGSSDFTMEMWVNFATLPASTSGFNPWIVNGWVTSANTSKTSFLLAVQNNKFALLVSNTDATTSSVVSTISLATDLYYHVICGRSSGNLFIRVVGKETRQTTAYAKTIAQRSSEVIWLGAGTNNGTDRPYALNGNLDEFALYTSLSDSRADAHHALALGWS